MVNSSKKRPMAVLLPGHTDYTGEVFALCVRACETLDVFRKLKRRDRDHT